jgi:hypothetical protein
LHHHVLASSASILWPAYHEHPQLRRDDVEPFAGIFSDPMQRVAAVRAGAIVDIDHHLNPGQMRRKRSPIHATFGGAARSLRRRGLFAPGIVVRRDLLGVFKSQQHLIFGQCLGASAEAMALQFLDDLFQPSGARPLGEQHRLQRVRIVRKRVRHDGHGAIESQVVMRREDFA